MVHIFFFSLSRWPARHSLTHQSKNDLKGGWEFSFNINVVTLGSLAWPILIITSLPSSGACCTLQASSRSSGMTSAEHSICAHTAAIPSGPPVTQIVSPHIILLTHTTRHDGDIGRIYINAVCHDNSNLSDSNRQTAQTNSVWRVSEWPYSAHPPLDPWPYTSRTTRIAPRQRINVPIIFPIR